MNHLALLALATLSAAGAETGFLNRAVTVNGASYRYVVFVPADWTADREWPVILFLHGSAERGDDGIGQSNAGLGRVLHEHPERFPAIVVMPQCRRGVTWDDDMEAQALAALDAATGEFNGDADRTYLTGFSMGGYGTWSIAENHPQRFAALVVVCGGINWSWSDARKRLPRNGESPYARTAAKLAHLGVWVFHGDKDRSVPVSESRRMVEALKSVSAAVRYTEYKGVGHNSWDRAYAEPSLPEWLFAQRREE